MQKKLAAKTVRYGKHENLQQRGNNMAFATVEQSAVAIGTTKVPILLVGPNANAWFRGNNLAEYLGYAQPRVAVTKLTCSLPSVL